jgi:flavodoxin
MSQTGNTKKVAEAIYDAIRQQKEIMRIEDVTSLDGYDLSFLGFPMYAFGPDEPVKAFLEKHVKDRTIALFVTHMSPEYNPALQGWVQKFKDAAAGANIVGVFSCQGQVCQEVKTRMLDHPNPQVRGWAQADTSQGQPDATRLERAKSFAKETIDRLKP